jgi:hypothetical protein
MPQISRANSTRVIKSNTRAVRDGRVGTGSELIWLFSKQNACQYSSRGRKESDVLLVGIVEEL